MDTALKFILPVILVAGVSHAEEPRTLEEYARRREIHNHRVEQEEIRMGEQAVRARDAELRASH